MLRDLLRGDRERYGLTAEQAARRLGVSRSPTQARGTDNEAVEVAWSDAWFLLAVAWATQSKNLEFTSGVQADLEQVNEAADAIDHARLRPEEVEHAERLLVPRFLRVTNDRYELTSEGRDMCEKAETDDVVATMQRLRRLLGEASR